MGYLLKEKWLWIAIALLYVLLAAELFYSSYSDDLGFDAISYMARGHLTGNGLWSNEWYMGYASFTFESPLPFVFLQLGAMLFGGITIPLFYCSLALLLVLPLAFALVARNFGLKKEIGVLAGLVFVLSPFTIKFLFQRFPEAVGWLFFLVSFAFYYRFISSEKFQKKDFALAGIFAAITILSHLSPAMLLFISFVFLGFAAKKFKKTILGVIFPLGLSAFWVVPYLLYSPYSRILYSWTGGAGLVTTGIIASKIFLTTALIFVAFKLYKSRERFPLMANFIGLSALLAVIYLIAPFLPVLNKPFAHSFNTFYVFALILGALLLLKEKAFSRKELYVIAVIGVIAGAGLSGIVARQYTLGWTHLDESYGVKSLETVLAGIPEDERFGLLPQSIEVASFAAIKGKHTISGHAEMYPGKASYELQEKLQETEVSCGELLQGAEKSACNYWIALNEEKKQFLAGCGLEEIVVSGKLSLFEVKEKSSLFGDGKIIEGNEKEYLVEFTEGGEKEAKISFFPRWRAFFGEKELPVKDLEPGMGFKVPKAGKVKLSYGLSFPDFLGQAISVFAVLLVFGVFYFKRQG